MVFPHKTMNNRNLKPSFFYVTENTNNNEKNFYRKMQLIDSALKRPADTWEVTLSPPVDDLGRCLRDLDLIHATPDFVLLLCHISSLQIK